MTAHHREIEIEGVVYDVDIQEKYYRVTIPTEIGDVTCGEFVFHTVEIPKMTPWPNVKVVGASTKDPQLTTTFGPPQVLEEGFRLDLRRRVFLERFANRDRQAIAKEQAPLLTAWLKPLIIYKLLKEPLL